ncbi:hypothetical protein [Bradyrhizobium sp.]|uniref:hypothetical protein n=1 Tax=Bradyrhizobium sp. TaxID=376 RepID=UPI0039E445EB
MKRFDSSEMDEIERELDELDALMRADRRRRRRLPAAGGGEIALSRTYTEQLRPRPAAFAEAVSNGMAPIRAASQAGYSGSRMAAWRLMRDKRVLDEIARLNSRR